MNITKLEPHQVFVFGSNAQGFHGAGSAGYAMRGDSRNNWRQDKAFLKAIASEPDSGERVGKWAVFGVARGYQVGHSGQSYAIQTVTRPGARRSISRRLIYAQLKELWAFAKACPELEFLITPLGQGYAGYTPAEMAEVWKWLIDHHGHPSNITFTFDWQSTVPAVMSAT